MSDDIGTKSLVDMALGAATTVAFAFGPVGVEIAAAIAVGKFLFDPFLPKWRRPDRPDGTDARQGGSSERFGQAAFAA